MACDRHLLLLLQLSFCHRRLPGYKKLAREILLSHLSLCPWCPCVPVSLSKMWVSILILTTVSVLPMSAGHSDCGSETNSTSLGQIRLKRGASPWLACPKDSKGKHVCNWPKGELYYQISRSFKRTEKDTIKSALDDLQKKLKGCIEFKERDTGRRVIIKKDAKCRPKQTCCKADVGYKYKTNPTMNLGKNSHGTQMENCHEFPARKEMGQKNLS